jgi:hypothetical protein
VELELCCTASSHLSLPLVEKEGRLGSDNPSEEFNTPFGLGLLDLQISMWQNTSRGVTLDLWHPSEYWTIEFETAIVLDRTFLVSRATAYWNSSALCRLHLLGFTCLSLFTVLDVSCIRISNSLIIL